MFILNSINLIMLMISFKKLEDLISSSYLNDMVTNRVRINLKNHFWGVQQSNRSLNVAL